MVATFWPTVGTVLPAVSEGAALPVWPAGSAAVLKRALICESRVVFPALSRPSRMIEYS
jgi:hypothetical protein